MKEALSQQCSDHQLEVRILEHKLEKLKLSVEPMDKIKEECKMLGVISARWWVNSFAAIILSQFFFTQYGTYVIYSWDIIEPITCVMSMSDAFIGYFFWLRTGKPWNITGLGEHFEKRKLKKLMKKNKIDMRMYE
mmetsp:Transcript_10303/g.15751  ORF Transcript_10303/g.15751 Transcript_10303/m.15751 type:complete len:135 (+) Transcript_10303:734-1138(+)